MTHPSEMTVQQLLRKYNLTPSKGLGQNFLTDEDVLARIVAAAAIPPDGAVLEIGPGLGSLTRCLAAAAGEVCAVELDRKLIQPLKEVLADADHVRIVQGDILDFDPEVLMGGRTYQVVANIPYYITSAVIRHLLNAANKPSSMVLTIQKEVAERLCAKPGNLSLLALSVQIFGTPELVFTIPAEAFTPQPKVDSAVVRIELFAEPKVADAQQDDFFKLIKAGFGQKRKTLRNALAANLKEPAVQVGQQLRQVEIDPMRRAETLSIEEWLRLLEHRS